jgi:hypothetical protein
VLERIKPIKSLVNEILDQYPESIWASDSTTFVDPAIGGGQMVAEIERRLRLHGHSDSNIGQRVYGFEYTSALIDMSVNMHKLVGNYSVRQYHKGEPMTKPKKQFTLALTNPPYNAGDILLYPAFFKDTLDIAETVVMVMPTDLNSQQVRLKKHNQLVKKHMIDMSENVTDHFGVGIPDIRYITASKNHVNNVQAYVDPLNSYQPILPGRSRLKPRRGNGQFSRKTNWDVNGVDVITSIYRGNKVQWQKVKTSIANKTKAAMQSSAPWLVLVAENPSKGLFNVSVVQNNGVKWGSGIFALDASSQADADALAQWLTSSTIQTEVQKMLTLKNTHSFSGPMMEKLPLHV